MTVGFLTRVPGRPADLLAEAFQHSPVPKAVVSLDAASLGEIVEVNAAFAALLGHDRDVLIGRSCLELLVDADRVVMAAALAGGGPVRAAGGRAAGGRAAGGRTADDGRAADLGDRRFVRADGTLIWTQVRGTVAADGACMIAEVIDDTERHSLAESEAVFRQLFESAPIGLAVAGPDGCWQRLNATASALLGSPEDQDLSGDLAALRPLVAGRVAGHQLRKRHVRADGHTIWSRVTVTVRSTDGKPTYLAQIVDVTAEDELGRRADQFRTAFDAGTLALALADDRGFLLRVNPAFEAMFGRRTADLAGHTLGEFTKPGRRATDEAGPVAVEPGGSAVFERRCLRPDGSEAWIRITLTGVGAPAGGTHWLVQCEDLTARERAGSSEELTAGQAEELEVIRLRSVQAVHRDLTAATDRDAVLRIVAERAVELFEAADGAAVELIDGNELDYVAVAGALAPFAGTRLPVSGSLSGLAATADVLARSADTAVDPRVNRETCAQLGITSMLVAPLHSRDRVIGCLQVSASRPGAFGDLDGQHLALLAVSVASALRRVEDDTVNQAALAALATSEARFRLAFENSPVGLNLVSLADGDEGRYLYVNPAMTAITGYSFEELNAMTFRQLLHPDDLPLAESVLSRVLGGETTVRVDSRYRHKDGHLVQAAVRVAAVRDQGGQPLYLVNQMEDVTTQRVAEADLQRQARLLELIPAAVIVRDPDGAIRWWNAGAERLYGWTLAAAAGRVGHRLLSTVFPDRDTPGDVAAALATKGSWDGSLQQLTAHGRRVTVLSRQLLHHPDDGSPAQILEINTDVTAARAAELALAESEQRFRAQFTHSAAGQVIQVLDGSRVEINQAYAAMLGYEREVLAGIPEAELYHPDDLEATSREVAALFAGEADSYTREGRLRHADGHWVDVSATVSIIRDEHGHPKSLIGVLTDVSARRAAELARDQAAAALAERNTELEAANRLKLDLIGMLGHEIGNPLSSIRGYSELLTEDGPCLDEALRDRAVATIARQAGRLAEIVREVLAMVTLDAGAITAVPDRLALRDEVRQALAAVDQPGIPVSGDDAEVLFHAGHLQQILVNLLSNAAKYGGGATAVRIVRDGARVQLRVEDRGPGVPGEFRHRLFERLARAERDAATVKGTGLGLYIVRGLAEANHGDIRYEPNPAGGSIFVLDLRAAGSVDG